MIPFFGLTSLSLGPITVQVWGLLVAFGILSGLLFGKFWLKKWGIDVKPFFDLTLWIMIGALFFARAFHVFFQGGDPASFGGGVNWLSTVGFMSTGGFFGALLVILVFYKKYGVKILPYLEAAAFAFPFGWFFGRIGCFLIHDHPGSLTKSLLAVNFIEGTRWDLGFLEALLMVVIAIIFIGLNQRRRPLGFYPAILMMAYGVARFGLDFLRAADLPGSDTRWLGLTVGQYGALLLLIGGIFWWKENKNGRFAYPA